MTTPAITSHAAPATWWSRIADVLHRMIVKHRPRMVRPCTGAHVYRARPSGTTILRMRPAGGLVNRLRRERFERACLVQLRTECERMANLLDGARRGHHEATANATVRATIKRETARTLHRMKAAARVPARTRFATATGHVRAAARETAAVAATAARQVGAHRHVGAATRAGHELAARALARLKSYERTRAVGENGMFTRSPRGLPA